MAEQRQTGQRFYFLGTFTATAPFHVGSQAAVDPFGAYTDMPVLRDHEGKPYLPATSIGGVLRGTAELLVTALDGWDLSDLLSLFGGARMGKEGKEGRPSKVRIRHGRLRSEWHDTLERRDSVGIDRQRAAARDRAKFDYEVFPSGLQFDLYIELREPDRKDQQCEPDRKDQQLLALCLQALQSLHLPIGAKGGGGLGWFEVKIDKVVQVNLAKNPHTLLRFLRQEEPFDPAKFQPADEQEGEVWSCWTDWYCKALKEQFWQVKLPDDGNALRARIPQAIVLTYRLDVEDPVLVKKVEAPEFSIEHFMSRRGFDENSPEWQQWQKSLGIDAVWFGGGTDPSKRNGWQPLLPGTSLRGVFRSHCERILRTLSWVSANGNQQEYERRVAACDPLEGRDKSHLHSAGLNSEVQQAVEKAWQASARGDNFECSRYEAGQQAAQLAWEKSDLAERMFGSALWRSPVLISEAKVVSENWCEQLFDHVAIERFSGGAVENKKFNALPITQATFEGKIVLLGDELWMLGLIALLFKDLKDELVRVGSGKSRGYGKVKGQVTRLNVLALHGTHLARSLSEDIKKEEGTAWLQNQWDLNQQGFSDKSPEPLKKLLEEAVKELGEKVKCYQRSEELKPKTDKKR